MSVVVALLIVAVAVLVWRAAALHVELIEERAASRRAARDVDQLADWANTARWVVENVHRDDLDQLIASHTPPTRPR